jgi:lipopolysaccharide export system permease protein
VQSLGRAYCDGLTYLEKRGFGRFTLIAVQRVADLLAPQVALAQRVPMVSPQAQGQDTTRSKKDSAARASDTSKARADSLKPKQDSLKNKPDSLNAASVSSPPGPLSPGVTVVNGDTVFRSDSGTAPAVIPVTPETLQGVPIPPPNGMSPTIPAGVAMETSRSQMMTARTQMNQFAVEIQKKFAISVACIVFVLLGAPIALRFPRGGVGLVIGVSLGVFGLYYVGLIAGESLADRSILTPFWAMWAANILFTAVALFLFSQMDRTSASARGGDLSEIMEAFKGLFTRAKKRDAAT